MKCMSGPIRKACAGVLALTLGVLCAPLPCHAEEPAAPRAPAHSIAALSPATLARLTKEAQPEPVSETSAFFKTKKGAAVLVLLGAGFGYALYSRSHDEIKSAIRQ